MVSLVLALASSGALGVALIRSAESPDASAGAVGRSTADPARPAIRFVDWVEVLHRLDARRSRAFARGEPALLDQVYVARSPELRRDRGLLRRYRERGLRVTGLRMGVGDLRLLERGDGYAVLRVRDRVSGGRVEDRSGGTRRLAGDAWSRHLIRLERARAGWRIAELRLVG